MRATYVDSAEQFTLGIMGYCGMFIPIIDRQDMADMADCRKKAARHLRSLRRDGFPVRTVEPGLAWEIEEPEDCVMVPDTCGTMRIKPVQIRLLSCSTCDSEVPEGETCQNCEEAAEEHARWLQDMAERDEEEEEEISKAPPCPKCLIYHRTDSDWAKCLLSHKKEEEEEGDCFSPSRFQDHGDR